VASNVLDTPLVCRVTARVTLRGDKFENAQRQHSGLAIARHVTELDVVAAQLGVQCSLLSLCEYVLTTVKY